MGREGPSLTEEETVAALVVKRFFHVAREAAWRGWVVPLLRRRLGRAGAASVGGP